MRNVAEAYRSGLAAWYGLETRWPERPFWARRATYGAQAPRPAAAGMSASVMLSCQGGESPTDVMS